MIGRYFCTLDDDKIRKVDIRSSQLQMRFKDDIKIQDVCNNVCDHLSEKYNFKKLDFDNIYNLKTGTFHESVKIYLMLYMLEFYLEVELLMRAKTMNQMI
jgi:hypothetical protein